MPVKNAVGRTHTEVSTHLETPSNMAQTKHVSGTKENKPFHNNNPPKTR